MPHLTLVQNIFLHGPMRWKKTNKALEILKKVGLQEHAYKTPGFLSVESNSYSNRKSTGKRFRILLCDEPTGSLDQKQAENGNESQISPMCYIDMILK